MFSKILLLLTTILFVSDLVVAYGKMGGGQGIIMISSNKPPGPLDHPQGDTLIFGSQCGTGIIKDGGKKGKNILVLPQCQQKKKKEVKIVHVPMPVKEYIPIPMKGYGGGGGGGGGMDSYGMDSMQMDHYGGGMGGMDSFAFDDHSMMGMDSKKSVTHVTRDKKEK